MTISVTVVHWVATYVFCLLAIITAVLSEWLIVPYLLSVESVVIGTPGPEINKNITAVDLPPSTILMVPVDSQPTVYIDFEPFCSSHPFTFIWITHSAMMSTLPVYYLLEFTRRVLKFPRMRTIKKRLREGGSTFGVVLAYIICQFDNNMIEGKLSAASHPMAFLMFGLLTMTLVISTFLWRLSLMYGSVPLEATLQHVYVIFLSPLMIPILKEKLNGLKLLSGLSCFFGIYIFFIPDVELLSDRSLYENLCAITLGISSSAMLLLYFAYYKLLNPSGWMLQVIGFQGVTAFAFGIILLPLLSVMGIEKFAVPFRSFDLLMILYHSISKLFTIYFINEALRWGDPLAIATALTVIPPAKYLMQSLFVSNVPADTLRQTGSLLLTLSGWGLAAAFHFSRAMNNSTSSHSKYLIFHSGTTASEKKRLVSGNDYLI